MKSLNNLSIVTCCTPNYAKYLGEWARALVAMKTYPAAVCIVLNGPDARSEQLVASARGIIEAAGIDVRNRSIPACNIGESRNAAVALSDTEWVQHFDCDDLAMPHMLTETAKHMEKSDVVAMGYERSGDLAAGPANRTKVYRPSRGKSTLDAIAPASGVSPFRRAFWERSPYRTDMIGGWDTALWIGFARLNARFAATSRTCFYYRQHADSTFNVRRKDKQRTAKVAARLTSLRRGDSGVSLIVPLRANNPTSRKSSWTWLRRRYEALLPELEIVTTEQSSGAWCKGAAINEAVGRARGEILVIADADCWIDQTVLLEAIELVRSGRAPWVVPHGNVYRMDQASTDAILALNPESGIDSTCRAAGLIRKPYLGFAGGGVLVVSRPSFDYAGGFPTAFKGWGCEDEALAIAFDTLLGPHVRLRADLWHFWHPPGHRRNDPNFAANRRLLSSYRAAAKSEETMYLRVTSNTPLPAERRKALPVARIRANMRTAKR